MIRSASPNFNARAEGKDVAYVVLHYTNMPTAQEALARMRDPSSEVSAHYLIEEDGTVHLLVDEDKRAWHAGQSFWRGERDLNSVSIGIELANPGHLHGYRAFPPAQIAALTDLLRDICARYNLPPDALLGHSDIAPTRKEDPGELFPWAELAAKGFGLWPTAEPKPVEAGNQSLAFALLRRIGYDAPDEDEPRAWAALRAFRRRYEPEALDEELTAATLSRLADLADRMESLGR